MRSVDTNVLLRYAAVDSHRAQTEAAIRFIRAELRDHGPVLVTNVVLAEYVWVLKSAYQFDKQTILENLDLMIDDAALVFENIEVVLAAIEGYRSSFADFSDSLIAACARFQHAIPVATFDRRAARHSPFRLLTTD